MGEMLGAWSGRQAEEELAQHYNRMLVENLKTIWDRDRDRDKAKRSGGFVDISDSKDKIHTDSWDMVPNDLRAIIKEVFGDDGFMIRKDMINNAVGYRAASITDPWTGISRMDEKYQEGFVKVVTALMGKDAFTYLATAEKGIQAGVSVAKSTIVVRSIIIPMANLASNFLQRNRCWNRATVEPSPHQRYFWRVELMPIERPKCLTDDSLPAMDQPGQACVDGCL